MPLYRRLPKRGFKSLNKKNIAILNLSKIQNMHEKKKKLLKNSLDLKIIKRKKINKQKIFKIKNFRYWWN